MPTPNKKQPTTSTAKQSRQRESEAQKTITIYRIRALRFRVLKPFKGKIEIINAEDRGRVCQINVEDFNSLEEAKIYARLLSLTPLLLSKYIGDPKKLKRVALRLENAVARIKKRSKK